MMTSPVSLLVRCARTAFPELRVVGICELPWTTLKDICETVGVDAGAVSFTYAGVNHLGWFGPIACGALDVFEAYKKLRAHAAFPSAQVIESCEGIPLKYLRLHYERSAVVLEQRARRVSRGDELQRLQTLAYDVFETGDREAIRRALDARPTPWYEDALGPLLAAMATGSDSTMPFFLSVPCRGALAGFGDDDILEIAHSFKGGDFERIDRSCGVPAKARVDLERFVRYERGASRAVAARDSGALAGALEDHPWVDSPEIANAIAATIADQDDEPLAAARSTSSA
jgi:alpha-galactosidase/6-phospho-beta-glucosidase family protein